MFDILRLLIGIVLINDRLVAFTKTALSKTHNELGFLSIQENVPSD